MLRVFISAGFALVLLAQPASASGAHDALIARHAAANGVPASLVHKVMMRESRGNARVVSKGNYGLMQIRLGTARGLGYTGTAAGLLDPDTNMTYAVRYLAGAYRAAGGNAALAQRYYQTGYYHAAKRQRTVIPSRTPVADTTVTGSIPAQLASKRRPEKSAAEQIPTSRSAPVAVATSAEKIPMPVAAPPARTVAAVERVPTPRERAAARVETIPMPPVAAPHVRTAAKVETVPTPVAAPHASALASLPAESVPTPVAAPHKTTRQRAQRGQATASNPVAQWLASFMQPSAKSRRAR